MNDEVYKLPLLITRGMVLFPNQIQSIEAGRPFSVTAIDEAHQHNADLILVTSQISPEIDEPELEDFYAFGVLARISNLQSSKKTSRLRVLPIARVKLTDIVNSGTS